MSSPRTTAPDIAIRRMHSNHLCGTRFEKPEDVVWWLGAMQAQDYAGAKWAIAQRSVAASDADIDKLFNDGKILRTHVLRPTWHFVMPSDIRWILTLTAPRVNAANAYQYRKLELDGALFAKSNAVLARALEGGARLTRAEIAQLYRNFGIDASGLRLGYLVMRAELDAVICSGGRRGKQFTYALLDERVGETRTLEHDAALAELTRRYFTSHGPAQAQDFAWWSGLTVSQARAGIEMASPRLLNETVDGKPYFFVPGPDTEGFRSPTIHLLPNYDEHLIAYRDYAATLSAQLVRDHPINDALRAHIIVLDGRVIGGWQRTIGRSEITVTTNLLVPLGKIERAALEAALEDYSRFMGKPVSISDRQPA